MSLRDQTPEALVKAASAGDRGALARLLSLVEQGGAPSRAVEELVFAESGRAHTVGITGPPGAGKSTLTDRLIAELRGAEGLEVGVLAVDPSSPYSGGAILGDRVRMQGHALDDGVFIRSMASRGHLGGLALAVPEAIRVLDAAGWPVVLVETAGVGQVEVDVASTCDTIVVVLNPGWGDSIQASKAGILEIADVFAINKADRPGAREARRDLQAMLELTPDISWVPPIVTTIASTGEGVAELWEAIGSHHRHLEEEGRLTQRRHERLDEELRKIIDERVRCVLAEIVPGEKYQELRLALVERRIDPYEAADRLFDLLVAGLEQ